MSLADAVFSYCRLVWMSQTNVSVVLLDPGVNGTASLPNVNLTTLAGYAVHAWSFPSQVIANYFMEYFEEITLEAATYKPLCWFRYVDDTFVIWPRGPGKLSEFLDHLNGVHREHLVHYGDGNRWPPTLPRH
jgi:hypothetical protein